MPPAARIPLEGHLVNMQRGLWCPRCNLPSAYTAVVIVTPITNPTNVVLRREVNGCHDCRRMTPIP